MYFESLLIAAILLLLVSSGAFVIYYKRIKKVHEEYEKARNVVSDVIISFNKQLERQEKRFATVDQKTDILTSETEKVARRIEGYNRRSINLANKLEAVSNAEKKMAVQIDIMTRKVDEVGKVQKEISQNLKEIEKVKHEVAAMVPKASIEAAIPIRKERALAPLTETELDVLEILAEEGTLTAPEIRERVKLTREHTSRLMKKLYDDGYLERDTRKMPYVYSIKEEMLKILKKKAAKA